MARMETLSKDEVQHCHFCGKEISDAAGYTTCVVVGADELPWHVDCAESVGVIIQERPEDYDGDFDYDPDHDGPECTSEDQ